jgi:hypothetical protein
VGIRSLFYLGEKMSTQEFKDAMKQYVILRDAHGEDHELTKDAFILLFSLAPDEYVDEAHNIAVEMNLIPDASGYLEDGLPMYKLDDIAAKNGVTIEEAEKSMSNILEIQSSAGIKNTSISSSNVIYNKQ